jgi:hypothetical protein
MLNHAGVMNAQPRRARRDRQHFCRDRGGGRLLYAGGIDAGFAVTLATELKAFDTILKAFNATTGNRRAAIDAYG